MISQKMNPINNTKIISHAVYNLTSLTEKPEQTADPNQITERVDSEQGVHCLPLI